MEEDLRNQLRKTLDALRAMHGTAKVNAVAAEVVKLGGGDAVDLKHLGLDDALADHNDGDPTKN